MKQHEIEEIMKMKPTNTHEYFRTRMAILALILSPKGTVEWLHRPNQQLGNQSPAEVALLENNGFLIVGNLISDMITGSPS